LFNLFLFFVFNRKNWGYIFFVSSGSLPSEYLRCIPDGRAKNVQSCDHSVEEYSYILPKKCDNCHCNEHMHNIKMDLLEIRLSVVDWIGLAQDRYRWRALVNWVMNLRVS
jgi:hypothetical protein